MEMKQLTWQDLKTFVNSLSDEQLQQTMKANSERAMHTTFALEILDEDYINPSGDGAEPVSAYENEVDVNGEPYDMSDEPIVARKGDVYIFME